MDIERINELTALLNYYADLYYRGEEIAVSDAEYDALYDELRALEEKTGIKLENSPVSRVGDKPNGNFAKFTHLTRLFSLDKCKTEEEIRGFIAKVKKETPNASFVTEYKFDGLTLSLTYIDGKLDTAATRGNGHIGENVTNQAEFVRGVPKTIPCKDTVEVRGEVILKLSQLAKYNETAAKPLKNARNGAAGAIRNLNLDEVKKRAPDFIAYDLGLGGEELSQAQTREFLIKNKFRISDKFIVARDSDAIIDALRKIEENRNALDFDIDGAVIKVNEKDIREQLGFTEKFPKWAMAYKFKPLEVTATVIGVEWNTARTGRITPTAVLEPVNIGGTTVSRATLNNVTDYTKKGIKINSRVLLRRSNDVIPEILGAIEVPLAPSAVTSGTEGDLFGFEYCLQSDGKEAVTPRQSGEKAIEMPAVCPSCGAPTFFDGTNIFCTAPESCKGAVIAKLVHFASRDAMNIEGFSEKTAAAFYEVLNVRTFADIYNLTAAQLRTIEGFKDLKTDNLLSGITKSKKVELFSFIFALGIPNVGIRSAKDLARKYKTLENLSAAEAEDVLKIDGMGEIISKGVYEYFRNAKNSEVIFALKNAGLDIREVKTEVQTGLPLTGRVVVVTGVLPTLKRAEAHAIIEKNGGEVATSVNTKVNLVVAGEDAGSKLTKAQELKIEIISEAELLLTVENG
ncbi:MAG: NAD-dependent DNA ligase LigA [Christensenellaceae bacterium]|jgi:DNA ligase (NAD+)|nr:NAD-dependent DNA ligase LigA [Christensenellaceae bacterium]